MERRAKSAKTHDTNRCKMLSQDFAGQGVVTQFKSGEHPAREITRRLRVPPQITSLTRSNKSQARVVVFRRLPYNPAAKIRMVERLWLPTMQPEIEYARLSATC